MNGFTFSLKGNTSYLLIDSILVSVITLVVWGYFKRLYGTPKHSVITPPQSGLIAETIGGQWASSINGGGHAGLR